jgi:hypothetical protein
VRKRAAARGSDKHEQQAREAARRFARGERGLGRRLTPAPAAGAIVAGSRGEPLPAPLQARLERSFGADLGAVSVHRDAGADAAARAEAARAYTAGRHIYFAAGAYDPAAAGGRELIAHEIAHVLQQTARAGADGRLQATDVLGPGLVQRQESGDAVDAANAAAGDRARREGAARRIKERRAARKALLTQGRAKSDEVWSGVTFNQLVAAHEAVATGEGFEQLAAGLAVALRLTTDELRAATTWPTLNADEVRAFFVTVGGLRAAHPTQFAAGGAGRGLLYDCLKKLRRFPDAVNLLKEDPTLRSVAFHSAVREALDSADGAELLWKRFKNNAPAQAFFRAFVANLDRLLLAPTLPVGALTARVGGAAVTLEDFVISQVVGALEPSAVGDNDLTVIGSALLFDLENTRIDLMGRAVQEASDRSHLPATSRRALAQLMLEWARELQGYEPEQDGHFETRFVTEASEGVQASAETALAYWTEVLRVQPTDFDPALWQDDPNFEGLRKDLDRGAAAFFALRQVQGIDAVPAVEQYAQRVTAWRRALLGSVTARLDAPLRRRVFGKESLTLASDEARLYGFALALLDPLLALLAAYSAAADRAQEATWKRDDVRAAHRLRAAAMLSHIAAFFQWTELAAHSRRLLAGKDRRDNWVHLVSDWELDPSAEPEMLADEVGARLLGFPFGGPDIGRFFEILLTQARARVLQELLEAESAAPGAAGAPRTPLRHRANQLLADFPLPKRWIVEDFVFSIKPARLTAEKAAELGLAERPFADDVEATRRAALTEEDFEAAGLRPGELVRDHPKTRAQLVDPALAREEIVAVPLAQVSKVFAWVIPPMGQLITLLRSVGMFNRLVIEAEPTVAALDSDGRNAWVARLDDVEWTQRLTRAIDAASGQERAAYFETLETTLTAELEGTRRRYRAALRKAAIVERRALGRSIRATLDRQDLVSRVAGPLEVVDSLQRFERALFPAAQSTLDPSLEATARLHFLLAMLDAAQPLRPVIAGDPNDVVVFDLTALVVSALETWRRLDATIEAAGGAGLRDFLAADEDEAAIRAGVTSLVQLAGTLRRVRISRVFRRGFKGAPGLPGREGSEGQAAEEGRPPYLRGLTHGARMEPGVVFTGEDGTAYNLKEVHRPFTYFPSYGPPYIGESHPAYMPGVLYEGVLEDGSEDARRGARLIEDDAPLLTLYVGENDEEELVVHARSGRWLLDDIAPGVIFGSVAVALEELATGIEVFVDVLTEVVVTLFGGPVGQAAKTAVDMAQLAASEEFATIIETFQNDPLKLVRELVARLEDEILTPQFLLKFLLFPSATPLDDLLARLGTKTKKAPRPVAARGRRGVGRVLGAFLHVGRHFAVALSRLRDRIQGPFGALRGRVASRPRLAFALNFIGAHGPGVVAALEFVHAEASAPEAELRALFGQAPPGEESPVVALKDGLLGDKAMLEGQLEEVVTTLGQLELPKEIVPLELLIEFIGRLLLKLMARKAKGRLARLAIERSGGLQEASRIAAAKMRGTAADPNVYWQQRVLPLVEQRFEVLRDELTDGLFAVLEQVVHKVGAVLGDDELKSRAFAYGGAKPPTKLEPIDGSFVEAAPALAPGAPAPIDGEAIVAEGAGRPLPATLLASAQTRFGHDFGHVRLHTGAEGARATGPVGALALTSGSHVYVSPRVSLDSEAGWHLLDHELVHVLQQAGPRPLGGQHSARPQPGRAGRGLALDPANEAAADALAGAVRRRTEPGPVRVPGGGDEDGYAPILPADLFFQLMTVIADYRELTKYQEDVDRKAHFAKKSARTPAANQALRLWDEIKTRVETAKKPGTFAPPFAPAAKHIAARLKQDDAAIKAAIPVLAAETPGHTPAVAGGATPAAKGGGKGAAKKPPAELHARNFAGLLIGYVYARTGVAITVDVPARLKGAGPWITELKVHNLHLGRTGLQHPLWKNLGKGSLSDDDVRELHTRLVALGPDPAMWDANAGKYALARAFVDRFVERRTRRLAHTPQEPPKKADYLKTGGGNAKSLQIATHERLKALKGREGRESHHTTQFLLVEYFSNAKKVKPFPAGLPYPGVRRSGATPIAFEAEGRQRIDIEPLYTGERGGPMPAILIAAETHRQGRLHVQRDARWQPASDTDDSNESLRQSFAIDRQFQQRLPVTLQRGVSRDMVQKQVTADAEGVASDIYDAMIGTYKWMYEQTMRPALKAGLQANELAYYRGLAARFPKSLKNRQTGELNTPWDMTAADLDSVFTKTVDNNRRVMSKYGWT